MTDPRTVTVQERLREAVKPLDDLPPSVQSIPNLRIIEAAQEAADLLDRCKEALEASKQAIASLPEDALGMVQIAFGIPGVDVYPARDELLSNLGEVLAQLNGGRNVG